VADLHGGNFEVNPDMLPGKARPLLRGTLFRCHFTRQLT